MQCIMIEVPEGEKVCSVERMVLLLKSRCYGNPTLNPVSHVCGGQRDHFGVFMTYRRPYRTQESCYTHAYSLLQQEYLD